MLKENILQLAASLFDETVATRRHLHAWPELSFQEYQTSEFVANKLAELNIPFEKKANTGIVGLLVGTKSLSQQVIALRADMDALPIEEANEVSYKSKNNGVMHACGHDVHTSSLLAVAAYFKSIKG